MNRKLYFFVTFFFLIGCQSWNNESNKKINEVHQKLNNPLKIKSINQNNGPLDETINDKLCGPACLEIYLNYKNISITKEQIFYFLDSIKDPNFPKFTLFHKFHNIDGYVGVNDLGLFTAAKHFYKGVVVAKQNWTATMIKNSIDNGRPVIMDVWYSNTVDPNGISEHFVIVKGYATSCNKEFIINDPWDGEEKRISESIFMKACSRNKYPQNHFFLIFSNSVPYHTHKITGPDDLNAWGLELY
jgi:hypothetical protein